MKLTTTAIRSLLSATVLFAGLLLAGCSGLTLGGQQAVSWFTLNDQHVARKSEEPSVDAVLIIGQVDANPFYDSTQLAFSRSEIARAYYQYAAWTERPTKRLSTLIERRLAEREGFKAVANATAGIRGDLLLNLSLEEIYHDTAAQPPVARIALQAALIQASDRSLLARKRFESTAQVKTPDAASAVTALNSATTELIDQLSAWVEQQSQAKGEKR